MIKNIKLQNFRNYTDLDLDLSKGNIFIGENGQGKTNILEAIYLLSTTRSFRTKDNFLIKNKEGFFTVLGRFEDDDIRVVVENSPLGVKKTFQKKGVKVRLKDVIGDFLAIIFSPEEVSFFTDSPGERRRHFDLLLSQSSKEYLHELSEYKKAMTQRNALLKAIRERRSKVEELSFWNEAILKSGMKLIEKRQQLKEYLNENIQKSYKLLTEKQEEIKVDYKSAALTRDEFERKLKEEEFKDIILGATTVGPHRDDFVFLVAGQEAANYCSRGEFRALILALKFCEGNYLEQSLKRKVTYLLDDVFSELDEKRRDLLYSILKDNQFIITTTDRDHIGEDLLGISKVFTVGSGKVSKITNN